MGKAYFENRDYLIPYEKVDRVAIRDSVAEVHTLSYSKPPVLRDEDAEAFMKGLRAYLEGQPIDTGAPKLRPLREPSWQPPQLHGQPLFFKEKPYKTELRFWDLFCSKNSILHFL